MTSCHAILTINQEFYQLLFEEAKRRKNLTTSELFFRRSKKLKSSVFTIESVNKWVPFESALNSRQFGPKLRLIPSLNPGLICDLLIVVFLFVSIFIRESK